MAPPAPAAVPQQQGDVRRRGLTPLEAGAIGAAVGVVGGMIIGEHVRDLNEVQRTREVTEGNGATFYSEPGRVIVREGDRLYVRHDEMSRFREFGTDVRVQQRGDEYYQTANRPDGVQIITVTDRNGELIRRIRRTRDGREYVLIDNGFRPRPKHFSDEVIVVPPPRIDMSQERYEVDASDTEETTIYETLTAQPVSKLPRRYTLDEVRYSRDLRSYMPSVDLNTITFSTGSWAIEDSEVGRLKVIADAINRAIQANPNEVYLIEGHTDAVGNDVDNLSLSDRRAQAVATILTRNFNVPPENLTTQGYGAQYLKVQTSEANRENRRVVVRRITPLIANGQQQQQ